MGILGPAVQNQVPSSRSHGGIAARLFLVSAGAILLITGAAKLWSSASPVRFLSMVDPLFGVQFRYLMALTGIVEIAVALVCFLRRNAHQAVLWVTWLSISILLYRIALALIGWRQPCHCLGDLGDALHMTPGMVDHLMKLILVYLLAGSSAVLAVATRVGSVSCQPAAQEFR